MDEARIAMIWTELKQYGDETQLGFPLSTIKVGELAELIIGYAGQADKIDRLQSELETAKTVENTLSMEMDDLRAEVELRKEELAECSGQIEWLDKSNGLLRAQIEGFK